NTRRHLTEIVSDQVYDCHMLGQLFLVRQNLFPRIGYARVDRTLHRERSDDSVVDPYESLRGENEKLVFVQQLVFCPTYMKQFVQGARQFHSCGYREIGKVRIAIGQMAEYLVVFFTINLFRNGMFVEEGRC